MRKGPKYFEFLGYKVLVNSNEIVYRNRTIKLTPKEMEVLAVLHRYKGETVSRSFLLESIWKGPYGNDSGLTQAISKLRRIFNDSPKEQAVIKTIPKKGYLLVFHPEKEMQERRVNWVLASHNTGLTSIQTTLLVMLIIAVFVILLFQFIDVNIRVESLA